MAHLSRRIQQMAPSPTIAMTKRAFELKAAGVDVITLSQGEPDFDTPAHAEAAGIEAIRAHHTRYTAVDGMPALKAAIARKFERDNGLVFAPDEITVSSGSKIVLYNAIMATVDPGDEVIIPAPYWVSYPDMVKLADGVPVCVPCSQNNGFRLRAEDLEAAITSRTRMMILNSPNNPSGAAYSARDLAALAEVLVRHPDVVVLTDEIYEHLVYDGFETASIAAVDPRLAPRTITCNGMAKGYGMTGWRIGFAGGPRELIRAIADLQSQNVNAPSTIGQHAAVAALDGPQAYLAERAAAYQARRDLAVARFDAIPGLACHRPEGAFYLFPSCAGVIGKVTPEGRRIDTDLDFVSALLDAEAVATVHGGAFGLSPHFRISYALSTAELEEGLERIARFCAGLR
ncbi:MAG TPA: pyridoxal phosphate-dependent aminotransferase [Kofleriaceae bacterium]|nr:pyridoxal phosphate-dependent aminotransferase [Kofleriaceae bacterium]